MPRSVPFRARFGVVLAAVLTLASLVACSQVAVAAPIDDFGSNPGDLSMYIYAPDDRSVAPALVVALHGCTQTASDYVTHSGWRELADRGGFVLVLPEQKVTNNPNRCFNWFEDADIHRDQGEALSVKQMVDHAVSTYDVDPGRVFVTGLSAGGAMTAVMLAAYPDVFAAGAVVAGLPYGCAINLISAFSCMNPGRDRTPAQWAQQVRDAFPDYPGPYPRVAIWHGTADTTVSPTNADESRDQWTAVHGLSVTPTLTGTLSGNGRGDTLREIYADHTGRRLVEVNRVEGMGHGTPVHPGATAADCGVTGDYFLDTICSSYYIAEFWQLRPTGK